MTQEGLANAKDTLHRFQLGRCRCSLQMITIVFHMKVGMFSFLDRMGMDESSKGEWQMIAVNKHHQGVCISRYDYFLQHRFQMKNDP